MARQPLVIRSNNNTVGIQVTQPGAERCSVCPTGCGYSVIMGNTCPEKNILEIKVIKNYAGLYK